MRLSLLIASLFLSFSCFGQRLFDANLVLTIPSGGYTYDAETLTYGTAITNNSGTINSNHFYAVDQFVKAAKAHGYWTSLLDCSPLAGNQTNAAVAKLKIGTGGQDKLTLKGGVTSADYTTTNGWNNPSTHWLYMNYTNPASFTTHGMSVWNTYPCGYNGGESPIGHDGTPSGDFMYLLESGVPTLFKVRSLNQTFSPDSDTVSRFTAGVGLWGFTRTGLADCFEYQNGNVVYESTTTAAQTDNLQPFAVMGAYSANSPTSPFNWTSKPIGWYAVDNGMATNYLNAYYTDVLALMKGLGRCSDYQWPQKAFLILGQSLATGGGAGSGSSAALLTSLNNTFALHSGGTPMQAGLSPTSLGIPRVSRSYFQEVGSETGWRAFADHYMYLCTNGASYSQKTNAPYLMNWAEAAKGYSYFKKTSTNNETYFGITTNVYEFARADIAKQETNQFSIYGQHFNVAAILCVHGESDLASTSYGANLAEWVANYQSDITAATGQTNLPPMFISQVGAIAWPAAASYPSANIGMLDQHENSMGSNILVMDKYWLTHRGDATHLINYSYQAQGEKYADAYFQYWANGITDYCLRPTNITRSGATVTVTFNKQGLILDTTGVTAIDSYGFKWTNNAASPPAISSVALAGANTNQATITLASDPGMGGTLRYAMNCTNTAKAGPVEGPRGNLRDAYPAVGSITGSNLYNWCVMFEKSVP